MKNIAELWARSVNDKTQPKETTPIKQIGRAHV